MKIAGIFFAVLCRCWYWAHNSHHVSTLFWLTGEISDWGQIVCSAKQGFSPLNQQPLSWQLLAYLGRHQLAPSHAPHQRKWMHVCTTMALHLLKESLWAEPQLVCAGRLEGMSQTYAFSTFQHLLCINLHVVNERMPLNSWANCCEEI